MAHYEYSKEAAEKLIKSNHSTNGRIPIFFGKIQLGGTERWIIDYEERDYSDANFKILENHSHRIDQILQH